MSRHSTRHTSYGLGYNAARELKKNPLVRRTDVHADSITVQLYKFAVGNNGVADQVNYELVEEDFVLRDVFDGWMVTVPAHLGGLLVEVLAATHVVHIVGAT